MPSFTGISYKGSKRKEGMKKGGNAQCFKPVVHILQRLELCDRVLLSNQASQLNTAVLKAERKAAESSV